MKKDKKKKDTWNLRLEIDRFFDKMRNKNENKDYLGTEHSYQNTSDLVNSLLIKCNEDYVITKEPKRNFVFDNKLREEGFRIYFSFKEEENFNYFKETLFSSFKEHLFIKIKRTQNTKFFMGQIILFNLKNRE